MKTNAEIVKDRRILIEQINLDGGSGWIPGLDMKKPNHRARVVWSNGGGWDHVSVSWSNRCPTWDEMAAVKKMFFNDEEVCVQFRPAKSEYVNYHPYCLHIWRYQDGEIPIPYSWMIGPKPGETMGDMHRQAEAVLKR